MRGRPETKAGVEKYSSDEGAVLGAVSSGKPRHFRQRHPAPTLGSHWRTDKLSFRVGFLTRMGFRGSRVQIPPSRLGPRQSAGALS